MFIAFGYQLDAVYAAVVSGANRNHFIVPLKELLQKVFAKDQGGRGKVPWSLVVSIE